MIVFNLQKIEIYNLFFFSGFSDCWFISYFVNFHPIKAACKTYHGPILPPGVNFTNILWAAFAPKSFRQKFTNPNCKYLTAVQITLVWLSISPIFYKQLLHTKVLCAPFMCSQFGFVIFWQKDLGAKAAHKMLVKLTPGACVIKLFFRGNRNRGN